MLWVYGHYKYFNFYSAGINLRRQILPTLNLEDVTDSRIQIKIINVGGGWQSLTDFEVCSL